MTKEEYNNKRKEILEDFIRELDNSSIVALHNAYCEVNNDPDSWIYPNDEYTFNELMGNKSAFDLAMDLEGDDYNTRHDYFTFSVYGPVSFDSPYDQQSPMCLSDILSRGVDGVIDLLEDAGIRHWDLDDTLEGLEEEFKKECFQEQWDKMLEDKEPMFTFPNGDYCYINYDEDADTLETGSACNAGFCRDYRSVSIEVEYDETLDYNLEGLYEAMTEENPELLEEPEENEND